MMANFILNHQPTTRGCPKQIQLIPLQTLNLSQLNSLLFWQLSITSKHLINYCEVICFTLHRFMIKCFILILCLGFSWFFDSTVVQAGTLAERVADFPHWYSKPTVKPARGDLFYPQWMAGNWQVESTLVDLAAPLAPTIVTPGFERNREYLQQPIAFAVRFMAQPPSLNRGGIANLKSIKVGTKLAPVIADRAFNGLNIARAYLADQVQAVKMDNQAPNRQITQLQGNRQLISTITGRVVETPAADRFITSEIFQQVFRGSAQPYLNQVETTTAYRRLAVPERAIEGKLANQPSVIAMTPLITADQITAIYLSPQDEQYFQAQEKPVALYRYRLLFFPRDKDNVNLANLNKPN